MTEHETRPVGASDAPDASGAEDLQPVRDLLAEHVPLALIVDLVAPEATSAEILEAEGLPESPWWEPAPEAEKP
jgi:hypothetical protein